MAERQCGELLASTNEKWIGGNHQPAGPQLGQVCENFIEIAFGAGI